MADEEDRLSVVFGPVSFRGLWLPPDAPIADVTNLDVDVTAPLGPYFTSRARGLYVRMRNDSVQPIDVTFIWHAARPSILPTGTAPVASIPMTIGTYGADFHLPNLGQWLTVATEASVAALDALDLRIHASQHDGYFPLPHAENTTQAVLTSGGQVTINAGLQSDFVMPRGYFGVAHVYGFSAAGVNYTVSVFASDRADGTFSSNEIWRRDQLAVGSWSDRLYLPHRKCRLRIINNEGVNRTYRVAVIPEQRVPAI